MKTKKKIRPISGDKIQLALPRDWEQLNEDQLRYVYFLRCKRFSDVEVLTYCLIRFTHIKVHKKTESGWICSIRQKIFRKRFFIQTWEVQYFIRMLGFLNEPGTGVVNFQRIGKCVAVDRLLRGVPFSSYLSAENYYQGYLHTQDESLLYSLAGVLYHDDKIKLSDEEKYSVMQWYFSLKNLLSSKFEYFFQRVEASENEETELPDMEAIMNAEIRALTAGDITKESQILSMDTWRALTELNEKAREIKELNAKK